MSSLLSHYLDAGSAGPATPEAIEAHVDRNAYQAHSLPEREPINSDCVVDPATGATMVRDGHMDHATLSVMGLHQIDLDGDGKPDQTADTWRLLLPPDKVVALQHDPAFQADYHALDARDGVIEPMSIPGYQAEYNPETGHLTGGGTFDFESRFVEVGRHYELDVAPHSAISDHYVDHNMSDGMDLSGVDRDSPLSNIGACSHGEFLGVEHMGYEGIEGYSGDLPAGGGDGGLPGHDSSVDNSSHDGGGHDTAVADAAVSASSGGGIG